MGSEPKRIGLDRMTPVQSRLAAMALTLAALVVAYFLFLHWWFVAPLTRIDSQMRSLRAIHGRYAAEIAERPLLEKRIAHLERGGATVGAFLSANDRSTAAANLLQRISNIVGAHAHEGSGCTMPSKMPIKQAHGKAALDRISVSITLDCGIQPLAAVLYDLERSLPYLFVDRLMISHPSPGHLRAQLTISGYLRPNTAS